ncbi:MAG: hypothetical protein BWX79_01265 [Alphaproteobacteria bacterium ADurb.Bin100]|nr:MAG: hypothetical protein BWX79_01265 [Alphaproteobacteria bacterium ADurb.Bin100]
MRAGCAAIATRVFQQVAHQPAQQLGHTRHEQAVHALGQFQLGASPCAFLHHQTQQVDGLHGAHVGLAGIEPTGQQDFIDQLVQLGNVARDLFAKRGPRLGSHQLHAHADAGQRRAQFVRGVGQQGFLRGQQLRLGGHQRLNAFGCGIEACRKVGDLVFAVDGHAGRQVAIAPALHAPLQGFEALRQPPHDGVDPQRHGQADHGQQPEKTVGRPCPVRRGGRWRPAAAHPVLARRHLQQQLLAVGQRHVEHQAHPQAGPVSGHGARGADQVAGRVAHQDFSRRGRWGVVVGRHPPGPAHHQRQHRHTGHHGQPDAQVQPAGEGRKERHTSSLAAAQRRTPRHAPSGCAWGLSRRPRWPRGCGPCARRSSGRRLRARGRVPLP